MMTSMWESHWFRTLGIADSGYMRRPCTQPSPHQKLSLSFGESLEGNHGKSLHGIRCHHHVTHIFVSSACPPGCFSLASSGPPTCAGGSKSQTLCGVVTFRYVISSGTRSCVSSLPAFFGGYWRLLEFTRVYRKLLEIHPHFYLVQCW